MPPKGSRAGPRYNNLSILRGIDLTDLPSLRILLSAFHTYITSSTISISSATEITDTLPLLHRAVFNRVTSSIHLNATDYPLLKDAVTKLSETHDRSNAEVRKAVREIEELGEEKVLFNPGIYWKEYDAALRKWEEGEGYEFNSDREIDGKKDDKEVEAAEKETPKRGRGRPRGSATKKKLVGGEEVIKDSEDEDTDPFFVESPEEKAKAKGRKSTNATPEKKGNGKNSANATPEKKRKPIMIVEEAESASKPTDEPAPSPKMNGEGNNGRKRKACQRCSDGHIGCDKKEPICGNCAKAGKDCISMYREKRKKDSAGSRAKKKYVELACGQV